MPEARRVDLRPSRNARRPGGRGAAVLVAVGVHAAVFVAVLNTRVAAPPEPPPPMEVEVVPLMLEPPPPPQPERAPEPAAERAPIQPSPVTRPVASPPPERPAPAAPAPPAPAVVMRTASRPPPLQVEPVRVAPPSPASEPPRPAPVAAAPTPLPPPPPSASTLAGFQGRVMARLAQVKRYPAAARARREEGTALVRFSLSRGGRVAGVTLDRSSGSSLLDREALETVRRAQPLPKVPADLPDPLTLTIAVEFALS